LKRRKRARTETQDAIEQEGDVQEEGEVSCPVV